MRKLILMLMAAFTATLSGVADTETVDGIEWHYVVEDGKAVIQGKSGKAAITNTTTGVLAIPSSLGGMPVTSIGSSAFYNCKRLTVVTIPNSVTHIGTAAFKNCSSLTSVTIPANVTRIASSAFDGCINLTDVTIPKYVCKRTLKTIFPSSYWAITNVVIQDSVTKIESSAFRDCTSLASVPIPSSVTSIGDYAFSGCSGLTSVTIPSGVTSIGSSVFADCSSLTNVTIPGTVKSIKNSTFKGCSSLTCVTITEGVAEIDNYVFQDCCGLTSLTIPTSVTEIGNHVFKGCSGLERVVFNGDAPKIRSNSFSGVAPDFTVRVRRSSVGWGVAIPGTWKGLRIEYLETETGATGLWPLGVEGTVSSSVYTGYLYDRNGIIAGLITVKVGKPNAKTKLAAVKATVTVDGKRTNLMASENGKVEISSTEGPTWIVFKGKKCVVELGAGGMSGYYESYLIDGSLNVFLSKAAADKAVASAALDKWRGTVNVAWPGAEGWNGLSVTIAAKGKAKVHVMLADGKKVSTSGQLIVGDGCCCVPVVRARMGVKLAFNLWLPLDGNAQAARSAGVDGLVGAVVGRPGTLKEGAKFNLDAVLGDAKYAAYLPDGVAVGGGAKWTLPTAGKVQLTREGQVDEAKLGENPSALKLTYKAKDGSFKGSFKAYADMNGRPKATAVKVTGVLVNGVGYGTATAKGANAPVLVE